MRKTTDNGENGWFLSSYEKKQLDKLLEPLFEHITCGDDYNDKI